MEIKLLQIRETTDEKLDSASVIADFLREEGKADRECFWVLHLDTQLQLISKELVSLGCLDSTTVHPREVFKGAILDSAATIITVHNHPGGGLTPSKEDIAIWNRLREAGEIIGIEVIDNLIITPAGKFFSERASPLLKRPRGRR